MWPSDLDQRGNPLPPSSRASGRRSRSALVRAASWSASSSIFGSGSTCGQPPLTVSTTVVSANAIVYDSQLDLMPSGSPSRATSDQRSPALWRGAPLNQGPWVPSGVKAREVQHGLKIDTTCSARRRGRVGAGRLAHPRPPATSGCIAPQTGGLVLLPYTVAGPGQRCLGCPLRLGQLACG